MPTISDIGTWFAQNIGWTVTQRILEAILVTAFVTHGTNKAFGLLTSWRKKIWFFLIITVPIVLILISVGESRQKPELNATIDYIVVTDETVLHEITAILTITIVNSGQVQSIASGLSLKTVIDGQTYIGVPTAMPEKELCQKNCL